MSYYEDIGGGYTYTIEEVEVQIQKLWRQRQQEFRIIKSQKGWDNEIIIRN